MIKKYIKLFVDLLTENDKQGKNNPLKKMRMKTMIIKVQNQVEVKSKTNSTSFLLSYSPEEFNQFKVYLKFIVTSKDEKKSICYSF